MIFSDRNVEGYRCGSFLFFIDTCDDYFRTQVCSQV